MTTPTVTIKPPGTRQRASQSIHTWRIKQRDGARLDYEVRLLEDETFEDALRPEFLGLRSDRLQPGDRVCIVGFAFSFWAELIVIRADEPLRAVWCAVLHPPVDLSEQLRNLSAFDYSQCKVDDMGGGTFRIMHGHHVVQQGFPSRAHAAKWLDERRREPVVVR